MRKIVQAAVITLFLTAQGDAQTYWSTQSSTIQTVTTPWIVYADQGQGGCDVNTKTPSEVLDCKLDYWHKQLESAQKRRDEAIKDIEHAQERIGAFQEAKKGK